MTDLGWITIALCLLGGAIGWIYGDILSLRRRLIALERKAESTIK